MNNSSIGKLVGIVIVVACLGYAGILAKSSAVSYVPFSDARQATDATVQIMGAPVQGTMGYDLSEHILRFSIRQSDGDLMPVEFAGPKPEDLDTAMARATKIAALGTFDRSREIFKADSLQVKCPSKYDGGSSQDRSYGRT